MYVKISDFFMGMGKNFTVEVLDIAEKLSRKEADVLFPAGDPANHFYVLLKGRVKLSLGEAGPVVYMARQPGEIIGWSGLIGRDAYSASAECMEETNLLKFNRDKFLEILKNTPRTRPCFSNAWQRCWAIVCLSFIPLSLDYAYLTF